MWPKIGNKLCGGSVNTWSLPVNDSRVTRQLSNITAGKWNSMLESWQKVETGATRARWQQTSVYLFVPAALGAPNVSRGDAKLLQEQLELC